MRLLFTAFACWQLWAAEKPLAVLQEAERRLTTGEGRASLKLAIEAAPDHAVFAIRKSQSVKAFAAPHFPSLIAVASEEGLPDYARARLAVLHRALARGDAQRSAAFDHPTYFATLVTLRLKAEDPTLDRVLHEQAEFIRSAWVEGGGSRAALGLARFTPRELYAVLAFGQREESEHTYAKFLDGVVAPRLGARLAAAIQAAHQIRFREFLVEGIRAKRVPQVIALLPPAWIARAFEGIDSPEQGALAAEVIEAYAPRVPTAKLRAALEAEHAKSNRYAGPLAAWLNRVAPSAHFALAAQHAKYLPKADALTPADLCAENLCLQRYIFFNDEDGVNSFSGFESQYRADSRWQWEDRGAYIKVARNGGPRTIEIYANRPHAGTGTVSDSWDESSKAPQQALSNIIAARGAPRVYVQRGHAYHVEKSIDFLPEEARLVFLGSCRGTLTLVPIVNRAHHSQVIATRSTGTAAINDPLLKAINDRLAADGSIDWSRFWTEQSQRFANRPYFESYIPPHRNGAAIFLHAWRNVQQASR